MSNDAATAPSPETATAGALLRAARERQGLHIAALAAAIKVSPRKLEALESDRWDELPDATFTRALAQTVCRTLKIDAVQVLERMPAAPKVALEGQHVGLNAPFRSRANREPTPPGLGSIKPIIWASAALMVAAVVVWLLPQSLFQRTSAPRPAPAPVAASQPQAAAVETPVAASAVAASATPLAGSTAGPALAPASAAASASVGPRAATPDSPATPAVAAAPAAAPAAVIETVPAPAPSLAGVLRLRAAASTWVEVRDGRGAVLLSRTLGAGEAVGVDGARPLRVTIGRAAVTEVEFKGQRIDLAPRTRDNVARLELN